MAHRWIALDPRTDWTLVQPAINLPSRINTIPQHRIALETREIIRPTLPPQTNDEYYSIWYLKHILKKILKYCD